MNEAQRIYAIIPAAGRSRRMGRDKQLIEIDGRPMLRVVVDTIAAAGVAGIMIVTRRAILDALQIPPGVLVAFNEDEHSEMIDSIRIGLRAWNERQAIEANSGFLICPGDLPMLEVSDVTQCIDAFRVAPDSIIIASHRGRRGHPVIVPPPMVDFVLSPACDRGLKALMQAASDRIRPVTGCSAGVLRDVDTPDDLKV